MEQAQASLRFMDLFRPSSIPRLCMPGSLPSCMKNICCLKVLFSNYNIYLIMHMECI